MPTHRSLLLPLCLLLSTLVGASFAGCGGSYASRARTRYLTARGHLPQPEEIRVADFLSDYAEEAPPPNPLAAGLHLSAARATYGSDREEVTVLQAVVRGRDADRRPPLALMLVVDRSGSMREQDKMSYVREAIARLSAQLDPQDAVGIVAFDNQAELLLPLTPASNSAAIRLAAERLTPRGGTNLAEGLLTGYGALAQPHLRGALRRVLLLTDAQANLGETDLRRIGDYAALGDEEGIRLSCVGVGLSYHDALMEQMAERGRGNHYFLDSPREIQRVFQSEVHGLLEDVADEVLVHFTPGPGIELLHVDGAEPERGPEGELRLPLARLGAGQHRLLLLTLRGRASSLEPGSSFAYGSMSLRYRDMREGEVFVQEAPTQVALSQSASEGTVVRNAVVASMARGLRAASELSLAGRGAEAYARVMAVRGSLVALIEARPEEQELRRDLQMVEDTLRTLSPPRSSYGEPELAAEEGSEPGYWQNSPVISVSAAAPYNQRATVRVR